MGHSRCIVYTIKKEGIGMTNAQRIRAMSDEELAAWLTAFTAEAFTAGVLRSGEALMYEQERLNWLRQPAEEET
jgi:hypothetical protein